jgi:hypothetical protein
MHLRYFIKLITLIYVALNFSCKNIENKPLNIASEKERFLILNSRACYFDDVDSIKKKLKIKIDTASKKESEEINTIMSYVGLPQNFTIYRGDIDNAMATVLNNERLIIYNKNLFTRIDDMDSSYWSSLFIIAHEIGHHLAYNISDTTNSIKAELEADIFAGSILFKMGADSNQVISAVNSRFISNTKDTKTHPSKYKRITAVKNSWMTASVLRYQSAIPPEPDDDDFILDGKDISGQYEFKLFQLFGYPTEESFREDYYKRMFKYKSSPMLKGIILDHIYGDVDEVLQYRVIKKVYIQLFGDDIIKTQKGYRMWVELPCNMASFIVIDRSAIYTALKVGRRIEFQTFGNNPNDNWFGYIKVIKPKKIVLQ